MIRLIGIEGKGFAPAIDNGKVIIMADMATIKEFQRQLNIKVSMMESQIERMNREEESPKVFKCRKCKKLLELDETYTKDYGSETMYLCKEHYDEANEGLEAEEESK